MAPTESRDVQVVHVGGSRPTWGQFGRELVDVAVAVPLLLAAPLLHARDHD